jgi:hypothetical protein
MHGDCQVSTAEGQDGEQAPCLYVQPKSGDSGTEFSVSSATVSVIQPVIVHLLDNSHITTELQFVTDRVGDRLETTRVQKKVPGR